jgi:hypothetical protein
MKHKFHASPVAPLGRGEQRRIPNQLFAAAEGSLRESELVESSPSQFNFHLQIAAPLRVVT